MRSLCKTMSYPRVGLHLWWLFLLVVQSSALNRDGVLLLSFKYSVLSDPLRVLASWNYSSNTPCSWNGVSCAEARVIGLSLPNSQLVGSIPSDLGLIEHLQILDLSNNSLNGSLPSSFFQALELRLLKLSNNLIVGEVPDSIVQLRSLQFLNLSENALSGKVPTNLANMHNLTEASLKNNYLSGNLPGGFQTIQVLDLSSNLVNGSLPLDFSGANLRYFNISYNNISGKIPPEFGEKIPGNATIDLSFNNLTGHIPDSMLFMNQESKSFSGNSYLCGEPTKNPCPIPSSPYSPPNVSSPTSPPAFAAFPNTFNSSPDSLTSPSGSSSSPPKQKGIRRETIIEIVVGDIVGIGIIALIFVYVYRLKRKKNEENALKKEATTVRNDWSSSSSESRGFRKWSCLRRKTEEEESSDTTSSSDSELEAQNTQTQNQKGHENPKQQGTEQSKTGTLVTVDGEKELEVEALLTASAYILGATGSTIMYKAVLEDGSALAVRRIGESGLERFKELDNQVRVIAKLVHPNLVRVRGFYWGNDEKLIIYDFVPNGSLVNVRYSKSSNNKAMIFIKSIYFQRAGVTAHFHSQPCGDVE